MDKDLIDKVGFGFRVIASQIPVASAFAQAWSEWESGERFKRVDEMLQNLQLIISDHQEELALIQLAISKAKDLPTLLEKLVQYVQVEVSPEKRKALVEVFFNLIAEKTNEVTSIKMGILDAANSLGPEDLKTLRCFAVAKINQVGRLKQNLFGDFHGKEAQLAATLSPLIVSLSKLESRGIIAQTSTLMSGNFQYSGDSNDWRQVWRKKTFALTPFGLDVVESLGW